jgi:mRNA interferase MazF
MEVGRGDIWWADLPDPAASSPGGTRPILIVQADAFNRSRMATVIAVVLTTNSRLAESPGNVLLTQRDSGLKQPSVANVSQLITADRNFLRARVGRVRSEAMARVDEGLRLILALPSRA